MSRVSSQIVYSDLTGGLNNIDTKETINSSPRKTETPDMVNVEYLGLGGIKTMEGNTTIGNKLDSPVVGGHEYIKGNNRYMMIATKDGSVKIYNEATDTYDDVYKFTNPSDKVSFCNMNNGVVISNGIDDLAFYEYGRDEELQGVVSLERTGDNEYSKTIRGLDTRFGVDVKVGDYIKIENVEGKYKVEHIDNDKTLTVDEAPVVRNGVEYFGFSGNEYTTSISSPNNLQIDNWDVNIDNVYNNLTYEYDYLHNGITYGKLIYPTTNRGYIISGEINQLIF
jgi:hypothetical protein